MTMLDFQDNPMDELRELYDELAALREKVCKKTVPAVARASGGGGGGGGNPFRDLPMIDLRSILDPLEIGIGHLHKYDDDQWQAGGGTPFGSDQLKTKAKGKNQPARTSGGGSNIGSGVSGGNLGPGFDSPFGGGGSGGGGSTFAGSYTVGNIHEKIQARIAAHKAAREARRTARKAARKARVRVGNDVAARIEERRRRRERDRAARLRPGGLFNLFGGLGRR